MHTRTRNLLLILLALVLIGAVGFWWYSGFSLDFMRFFAAEPTASPQEPVSTCQPRPECLDTEPACLLPVPQGGWCPTPAQVQCSPSSQIVAVGAQAVVSASGGASLYTWYAPEGTPSTGTGTVLRVAYATAGTKKVTVESARVPNDPAHPIIDSVACTVVVQP
jgi:hypothetical protein